MWNTSVLLRLYRILNHFADLGLDLKLFRVGSSLAWLPVYKSRSKVEVWLKTRARKWAKEYQCAVNTVEPERFFYCCEIMFFLLKALSWGEYFSSLMTMLAKVGSVFGKLVRPGWWGQLCAACWWKGPVLAFCEADLLVLWSHFVAKKGLFLAIRNHWIVRSRSLPLMGPRAIVEKVS